MRPIPPHTQCVQETRRVLTLTVRVVPPQRWSRKQKNTSELSVKEGCSTLSWNRGPPGSASYAAIESAVAMESLRRVRDNADFKRTVRELKNKGGCRRGSP